MRADVMISWIVIGTIGVVLYMAPQHVLKIFREGFEAVTGKPNIEVKGSLTPEQIDTMRGILATPSFGESKGAKAQPDGITGSSESKASHADVQNVSCLSSAQGVAYKKMSDPGQPLSTNLKTQDSYLPKPIQENGPACPDLKDYIRKDKIPCWGCKI
jgi:hypothetical protein